MKRKTKLIDMLRGIALAIAIMTLLAIASTREHMEEISEQQSPALTQEQMAILSSLHNPILGESE